MAQSVDSILELILNLSISEFIVEILDLYFYLDVHHDYISDIFENPVKFANWYGRPSTILIKSIR